MKLLLVFFTALSLGAAISLFKNPIQVRTGNGVVEGVTAESGIHIFRGLPYAAPPVRDLRWRPPQPAADWEGIRKADRFADQCMQRRVFDDMRFRNSGTSEDCLYLNVWTPDVKGSAPVLVYYYGGGFIAGDGSEPRYDGESMAEKGIVVVTMSYRLGIFGFFAHPELTAESPEHASGNYTLLDQAAALEWVRANIAAFGGDPNRVTIAGESAGSFSVSALMASPLSRNLIAGVIGESGSLVGNRNPASLAEMEANGVAFAKAVGAASLSELRDMSAMALLLESSKRDMPRFSTTVDGSFFPKSPVDIYAAGEQAHVPLMVGWNSAEGHFRAILGREDPTPENYAQAVHRLYGEHADEILEVDPALTTDEVLQAATALAGDRFIGFGTWKWFELHRKTGEAPVFRYFYDHPRPPMKPEDGGAMPQSGNEPYPAPPGAAHSAEIEYAMGNLDTNPIYEWKPEDYQVSKFLHGYFANFIKTGDPNGPGLPEWPAAGGGEATQYMRIDLAPTAQADVHRPRYLVLDRIGGE